MIHLRHGDFREVSVVVIPILVNLEVQVGRVSIFNFYGVQAKMGALRVLSLLDKLLADCLENGRDDVLNPLC